MNKEALINYPHAPTVVGALVFLVIVGVAAFSLKNVSAGHSLESGKRYFNQQRWAEAGDAFNDAIKENSRCAQAFFYRGLIHAEKGEFDQAEQDFSSAADFGTSVVQINLAQAGVSCHRKQWARALEFYEKLPADTANLPDVLALKANCYIQLGDYAKALNLLNEAIKNSKDKVQLAQLHCDRGFAELKENRLKEALADLEISLKLQPNKETYVFQGMSLAKLKEFDKAADSYTEAIKLDRNYYDAYVARGICEVQLHKNEEALEDFSSAIALNDKGVEALIQRGSLRLARHDFEQAAKDLDNAYRLNPTIAETKKKLEIACHHSHHKLPVVKLEKVAETKLPKDADSLLSKGIEDLSGGNTEEAVICLTEAVRKEPNNPNARHYLAHALSKAGLYAASQTQFEALLTLNKLTDDDAVVYAKELEASGKQRKATEVLAYLLNKKESSRLRTELAKSYYNAGMKQQAEAILKKGVEVGTSDSDKKAYAALLKNPAALKNAPVEDTSKD